MKTIRKSGMWLILLITALSLILSACGSGSKESSSNNTSGNNNTSSQSADAGSASEKPAPKVKVTVGGKDFTEQRILSAITSIYLKEKGYPVEEVNGMGSTVVRSALENGQIDVYWEYTGTGLVVYQKQPAEADPVKAYETIKNLDKELGLVWLNRADFNNTYAILMRRQHAEQLGIKTISDLAKFVNENPTALKFATNAEFYARDDGMKGLEKTYGFAVPANQMVKMDSGLLYNALKEEQVDVSNGFATDGRIKGFDLVTLEDDKMFFPAYHAAPVIRQAKLNEDPELANLLNAVADKLDTETIVRLNYSVDVEHKEVAEVAREWLSSVGLI
jgi:osmoprotectant transport system substrate-binding protein